MTQNNDLDNNLEDLVLKNRVLSKNNTFKAAFTATLGFYAGQFVATLLGLGTIGMVIFVIYELTRS